MIGVARCPLRYQYESPPTELECHTEWNTITSQLHCRVALPCSARTEIQWYYSGNPSNYGTRVDNTSNYTAQSHLVDSYICSSSSAVAEDALMIVVSELVIENVGSAHEGYYWCKIVVLSGTDELQEQLHPSECIKLELSLSPEVKCITHGNMDRWDCADAMPTRCSSEESIESLSSASVITFSYPYVNATSISAYVTVQRPTTQLNKTFSATGCTAAGIPCYSYAVIACGAFALITIGGVIILLLLLCLRARRRKKDSRSLQQNQAHSTPTSTAGISSLTDMSQNYTSNSSVTQGVSESEIDMTDFQNAVKDDSHIYSYPIMQTREKKRGSAEHGNMVTLPTKMSQDTGTYCYPHQTDSTAQRISKEYKSLDDADYMHMYSKPVISTCSNPHTPSSENIHIGYKTLEPEMMDGTSVYTKPGQRK